MKLKNTPTTYGALSITLHWVFALLVFGLFGLGVYMVELTYYDTWYRGSVALHESIGITLFGLLLLRILWRMANVQPTPAPAKPWEHAAAALVHGLLYLLPLLLMLSGYLISTADGRAISVFETFSVPALPALMESQEDFFGELHEILAWVLMGLAGLHAAAALKHHFIDKNNTLKRMIGIKHRSWQKWLVELKQYFFNLIYEESTMKTLIQSTIVTTAMAAALCSSAIAQAADYVIDTNGAHASVQFKIKHLGYSWLTGRFNTFDGKFSYDPKAPEKSNIDVNINTASIDSNHAKRDKHLRSKDFLSVDEFPSSTFKSTKFVFKNETEATVTGDFTLHGVIKSISFPITKIGEGKDPWGGYRVGFEGKTTIKMADYGITYNLGPASEFVEINLFVEGVQQ